MLNLNKRAMVLVRQIIQDADTLGCKIMKMGCGVNVIDMGLQCRGSWQAGMLFTRITMGDLGIVQLGGFKLDEEYSFSSMEVFIEQPVIACLASQIAGWKLGEGEFATIGSGPARAIAALDKDQYFKMTEYREKNDEAVLCIQDIKYPDERIGLEVANACGVKPENTYLLVAPNYSVVTSMQVAARMIEQTCHKMFEKGFDANQMVMVRGKAPVAPIAKDEVKTMGRINDALIYGSEIEIWVDSTDQAIAKVVHQLVSKTSSPNYAEPFSEIFEKANRDFYNIDHDVHSVAKIQIHNVNTGKAFCAGEINYSALKRSFLQ